MSDDIRTTPLAATHEAAGARMIPFAGWSMPVQYQGIVAEHQAVRTAAGLFDVSHMGEFHVEGAGATEFLQRVTPNNVARLDHGQAHYSGLLTPEATYVDDLLVYRRGDERYLLVVNASNRAKDLAWLEAQGPPATVALEDVSDGYGLLALQGPEAQAILARLTTTDLDEIGYYRFVEGEVASIEAIVSRTGYTGEDGFELYVASAAAPELWARLMEAGRDAGLVPAGLGARDTLRLEAGMALYGHEIDDTTTPLEAGLGWVVKWKKGDFVGRDRLVAQREGGLERRLSGFVVEGRGIAREGYPVRLGGEEIGAVRSGSWAPFLEQSIGTVYVSAGVAAGTEIAIEVRKRELPARLVDLPFYRRPR